MAWWFLPPVTERVPPIERAPQVSSWRYHRAFNRYWRGQEVTVAGRTYQGGRWHEVTSSERDALIAAGYGSRIVQADDPGSLPILDP
jgi:hypothetical protein